MNCPWKAIQGFDNRAEFDRFLIWMAQQVNEGISEQMPVNSLYSNTALLEQKWFRHLATGMIWRLVWPDAPFTGVFEPVISDD